jgi:hypothetical protein
MKKGLTQLDTTKYYIFRPTVDKDIWAFLTKKSGRKLGRMQAFRDDMLRLAKDEKPLSLANRLSTSLAKRTPVYYLVPAEDVELAEALERHSGHTGSIARLLALLAIKQGYEPHSALACVSTRYSASPKFMLMPVQGACVCDSTLSHVLSHKDDTVEHPRRWSAEWLQQAIMAGLDGINSQCVPDISSGQRVKLAMPQGDMPASVASALLSASNHLQICPEQLLAAALLRGTKILKDSQV